MTFPPVVMRRMAELNQARTHAEQLTNNTTKNQTSGCDQQICMTRIAEESDPTIHTTEKSSIEEPDFSKRPGSAFNSGASRCDFSEEALTPSDVDYSDGARDLIQRLLNSDPQKRLRSLLSLQNIRFFKNFDFANVRTKKISPKEVLLRYYPDGPKPQTTESAAYFFEDFDSIHI
ncbi:hypothetical protein LSTR_LSTR000341 [Laodelphax striatellus]|uniref:Uncharacterized protein n=1 Tax=Laodelphax striatellus TaxID=195883 RepID=A0A482X455_LAOST|nr:hypothetical protein LSTR_LSTR000341 [Laodelphax striatellus]